MQKVAYSLPPVPRRPPASVLAIKRQQKSSEQVVEHPVSLRSDLIEEQVDEVGKVDEVEKVDEEGEVDEVEKMDEVNEVDDTWPRIQQSWPEELIEQAEYSPQSSRA